MKDEVTQEDRELFKYLLGWDVTDSIKMIDTGRWDSHVKMQRITRFRREVERRAYERAAGVCEEQTRLNANARRDRADDTLAFEFEGLGSVIAAAIRGLGGEG